MFNAVFAAATVIAAADAAIAIPAQQAEAMDVGQCFSAAEMRQHS
jgi:hypothetical protein